jgi:hypothetical protein
MDEWAWLLRAAVALFSANGTPVFRCGAEHDELFTVPDRNGEQRSRLAAARQPDSAMSGWVEMVPAGSLFTVAGADLYSPSSRPTLNSSVGRAGALPARH